MMRTNLLLLASLAVFACSKDESPPAASKAEPRVIAQEYSCQLEVVEKKEPLKFEASVSGTDEAKVEADAWAAVCAKVPEADRATCGKDSERYTWSSGGGAVSSGGKTTHSKTITLVEKRPPGTPGRGKSTKSSDEACATARLEACKALGQTDDCTTGGKYEAINVGTGSTSTSIGAGH